MVAVLCVVALALILVGAFVTHWALIPAMLLLLPAYAESAGPRARLRRPRRGR